jgi:hypothetical protein
MQARASTLVATLAASTWLFPGVSAGAAPPPRSDAAVIAAAKARSPGASSHHLGVKRARGYPNWAVLVAPAYLHGKLDFVGYTIWQFRPPEQRWYQVAPSSDDYFCRQAAPGFLKATLHFCLPGGMYDNYPPLMPDAARFSIPCGTVQDKTGRRFRAYLVAGWSACTTPRQVIANVHSLFWRHYGWRNQNGPWTDVWERADGLEFVGAIRV